MLQWIRRNIAAFGGDPSRVFLLGTSAGGGNICALITSPLTRGLIRGVSMQSSVPSGCEIPTLADARNGTGQRVAGALGCDKTSDVAACLRGKNTKEIVTAVPGTFCVLPRLYGPNVDGVSFPISRSSSLPKALFPHAGDHRRWPIVLLNDFSVSVGRMSTGSSTLHRLASSAPAPRSRTIEMNVRKRGGHAGH